MLVEAVNRNQDIAADLCIIGAGAAGITLARELSALPLTIAVLESGGLDSDDRTADLSRGETSGVPYDVGTTRLRYFGGTTNHWGGQCRPLDEIDFEPRTWVPGSGWPFPRSELEPYYARAQAIIRLGPKEYDLPFWQEQYESIKPLTNDERLSTAVFQVNPLRFGPEYFEEIAALENVIVYLHANAIEVVLGGGDDWASHVRVATLAGQEFAVSARAFVLASGGIENARLMLASNGQHRNGLGNDADVVGRYFLEHAILPHAATLILPESMDGAWFFDGATPRAENGPGPSTVFGAITHPDSVVAVEHLLGFSATLLPERDDADEPPNRLLAAGDVESLIGDQLPPGRHRRYRVLVQAEQVPDPDHRVTLTDEVDALGVPRVHLHWDLTDTARRSIRRGLQLVALRLGPGGSRMWIAEDVGSADNPVVGGSHHMGTTRMHPDPAYGVVDSQCRVHGIANLYVAGSSVFPTGGYANPTLTIVALTLRLADELARTLLP
jgi:choline dehydrogenase-like flavoprotein